MSLAVLQPDPPPDVRRVSNEELQTSALSSVELDSFFERTYIVKQLE
jgi:hypothetical protein